MLKKLDYKQKMKYTDYRKRQVNRLTNNKRRKQKQKQKDEIET